MTTSKKVEARGAYYRMQGSNVWHWMEECQFYPPKIDPEQEKVVVSLHDRPAYGTLCDHCQNLEKKENDKVE